MRSGAVRPTAAPLECLAGQGGAPAQSDHIGQRHHPDHRRAEQHRIKQHRTLEQRRVTRQDQASQHPAKTVAQRISRGIGKTLTTSAKRFYRQLGTAVPAMEPSTVIALAMALHIAQPQVEILGQQRQQRRIHPPAIAIAMQKVQHRFARRRRIPATQGKTGAAVV
jgi:hypothetical protein